MTAPSASSRVTMADRDIHRIGIVTPALNAERFIGAALESIWRQEHGGVEIEHVIVDGKSTDDTHAVAARYPSRLIVESDNGMYEAINRGMRVVRGDIIAYINADDELAPHAIRRVVEAFRDHPDAQWLCGRIEYIDGRGSVLGRMKPVRMSVGSYVGLGWSCIPQQTVWTRRSFLDRVGPFDTGFKNCADYDWYVRALELQHPLILSATLGRFRLHGDQLSFNPEAMQLESRMVQERHGGRGASAFVRGKWLSLRLNARNPLWLIAKKTGRIRFTR
jgi:glycosyltransferase involved in cell wall biosynthesis